MVHDVPSTVAVITAGITAGAGLSYGLGYLRTLYQSRKILHSHQDVPPILVLRAFDEAVEKTCPKKGFYAYRWNRAFQRARQEFIDEYKLV